MTAGAPSTRFATETDIDAVAQLLRAMDAHYCDPPPTLDAYSAMVASCAPCGLFHLSTKCA